ncbi:hypothetical protein SCHPADRAFT_743138 [Schizopora paradoxa]|uniref:Uncharacterized protein n=1 Tax=Schizopora paradoxa TaxID=27342 RepID=A0A0H2QZF8_9AGAM|nr:hypothetical protein SCHPADRAFT_743138 [Schizopora paradoxa]
MMLTAHNSDQKPDLASRATDVDLLRHTQLYELFVWSKSSLQFIEDYLLDMT